jgi:hypothetical protein
MHTQARTHPPTHTHTHTNRGTLSHGHTHMHTHTHTHRHTGTHTHTQGHTYMHTHRHAHTHMHTHRHTHTQAHTRARTARQHSCVKKEICIESERKPKESQQRRVAVWIVESSKPERACSCTRARARAHGRCVRAHMRGSCCGISVCGTSTVPTAAYVGRVERLARTID